MLERVQAMIRKEAPNPPVADLVGFRVIEVAPGRALFEMEAGPQHANPMGTVHGGILCDLADAAMGIAYASTLGEGESFTTLELKINFLKPRLERRGCAPRAASSNAERRSAWSNATSSTRREASWRARAARA